MLATLRKSLEGERAWFRPANQAGFRDARLVRAATSPRPRRSWRRRRRSGPHRGDAERRRGLVRAERPDDVDVHASRARPVHGAATPSVPTRQSSRAWQPPARSTSRRARGATPTAHGCSRGCSPTGATSTAPPSSRPTSSTAARGTASTTGRLVGSTQHAAVETLRALAAPDARRGHACVARRRARRPRRAVASDGAAGDAPLLLHRSRARRSPRRATIDGAAPHLEQAHALAERTSMRFYDAETMRRTAYLETDPDAPAPCAALGTASRARATRPAVRAPHRARPARARGRDGRLARRDRVARHRAAGVVVRHQRGPRGDRVRGVSGRKRQRRHPRRRHGRDGRGVAAQRAGLARRVRVDHGVPTGLAARRQGREQPRARTGGSRSTACTSGSATTRTPSGCCASATPSSTVPTTDPTARVRPGATR